MNLSFSPILFVCPFFAIKKTGIKPVLEKDDLVVTSRFLSKKPVLNRFFRKDYIVVIARIFSRLIRHCDRQSLKRCLMLLRHLFFLLHLEHNLSHNLDPGSHN